jgi:O-antigen/teichoic acid export membrane protein
VTELGLMLPRALNAVVFPRVASLDAGADEGQRRMVISKSVRHTLLQTPLTLAVLVIGLLAVPLVYGEDFGPALEPGLILLPGVAALGLSNVLSATVSGRGYPQYAMYTWVAVTPIAIALYWLLIPGLGSEGAALGSTLVYTLNLILIAYCFRLTAGFSSVRELLPGHEELAEYRALAARLLARVRPGR